MADWLISFIVKGRNLDTTMEKITAEKVDGLSIQPVGGTGKHMKPGDKKAWEIVAEMATRTPQLPKFYTDKLVDMGFKKGSVYNAIYQATQRKLVRRLPQGKGKPALYAASKE